MTQQLGKHYTLGHLLNAAGVIVVKTLTTACRVHHSSDMASVKQFYLIMSFWLQTTIIINILCLHIGVYIQFQDKSQLQTPLLDLSHLMRVLASDWSTLCDIAQGCLKRQDEKELHTTSSGESRFASLVFRDQRDQIWIIETEIETEKVRVSMTRPRLKMSMSQ